MNCLLFELLTLIYSTILNDSVILLATSKSFWKSSSSATYVIVYALLSLIVHTCIVLSPTLVKTISRAGKPARVVEFDSKIWPSVELILALLYCSNVIFCADGIVSTCILICLDPEVSSRG